MPILQSWRPKLRNIKYDTRPEGIPEAIYIEALAAKRFYNEQWEFWVWSEAQQKSAESGGDIPISEAEDACIRGLKKALNRVKFVYGDAVGEWYERFLDMGDIFNKVKHPDYQKRLGY